MRPPWSIALGRPGRRQRVLQLPLLLWLAVVWSLLWGTLTPGNLITGFVVGAVVTLIFPLPRLDIGLRFHPMGLLRLAGRFATDMLFATARVSRQILSPGDLPCAMLELPLRSRSDLLLTVTTLVVQAVPGSTVVEIHRKTSTLYLHVLGAGDEQSMDGARSEVLRQEDRVVRALGTAEQIALLDAAARQDETGGSGPADRGEKGGGT